MRSDLPQKDVTIHHSHITGLALRSPKGEGGSRATGKPLNHGNFRCNRHRLKQHQYRAADSRHTEDE